MQKASRYGYLVVAVLFMFGIMTQVFFVGLSLLGGRPSWNAHVELGHALGILTLLLVILAYTGRQERPIKPVTWLNLIVYLLLADVVIFLRGSAPLVAALHPVLAVSLFGTTGVLVSQAWRAVRSSERTPAPRAVEVEAA